MCSQAPKSIHIQSLVTDIKEVCSIGTMLGMEVRTIRLINNRLRFTLILFWRESLLILSMTLFHLAILTSTILSLIVY